MNNIAFYFATRSSDAKQTSAYKSLIRLKDKIDILFDADNKEGLSKKYNEILNEYRNDYKFIVFVHDDVYVDDLAVNEKLEKAHQDFDIVGLAGGVNPKIQKLALWHLMCGGFNGNNLRGAVAHPCNDHGQIFMTSFGPTPARVAILDGLFMSINTKRVKQVDWKFNENYTFHHYDIASSLDANVKKLKLGVAPIWVVHKSPGLLKTNDEIFVSSQDKFLKEYSGY
jgi:hypothetical protein